MADIDALVRRPTLWAAVFALNGISIGILWVMVSKPGWTGSIATVAGLGLIGAILGSVRARQGAALTN
jgi:hypothetical protein